eukprot:TRINITY_DN2964_c0_g1_i1.p1 TRINITY_DN2964_c0_g1~~TRINITY_DN2964_c0_g1_i1.p1  ORF type:complete len:197 (-),score=32.19 TRINITY_DN2964_c0_g1_i1:28-618(-)
MMETVGETRRRGSSYDSFGTLDRPVSLFGRMKQHWKVISIVCVTILVGLCLVLLKSHVTFEDQAASLLQEKSIVVSNSTVAHPKRDLLGVMHEYVVIVPIVVDQVTGRSFIVSDFNNSESFIVSIPHHDDEDLCSSPSLDSFVVDLLNKCFTRLSFSKSSSPQGSTNMKPTCLVWVSGRVVRSGGCQFQLLERSDE